MRGSIPGYSTHEYQEARASAQQGWHAASSYREKYLGLKKELRELVRAGDAELPKDLRIAIGLKPMCQCCGERVVTGVMPEGTFLCDTCTPRKNYGRAKYDRKVTTPIREFTEEQRKAYEDLI